jgi:hypothetical protein
LGFKRKVYVFLSLAFASTVPFEGNSPAVLVPVVYGIHG